MTDLYTNTWFYQSVASDIRLFNIVDLHIEFPIDDRFWSIAPNLEKLKILSISFYADTHQSKLPTLFDRAPYLRSLHIRQDASLPLQMSLFTQTNVSIRHLNLYKYRHCFNEDECLMLTRSYLTSRYELLLIQVRNRESIIILVKNMVNLRSLIVKCADDQYKKISRSTSNNDELVQWLKERLSASYTIVRSSDNDNDVSIWM